MSANQRLEPTTTRIILSADCASRQRFVAVQPQAVRRRYMSRAHGWKFAEHFPDERRARLESIRSFDEVVVFVARDMRSVVVSSCRGRDPGLTECVRPVFTVEVPNSFDAFFNSPAGYRAQFLADADLGQAANSRLIHELLGELMNSIAGTAAEELSGIDIKSSLLAASAKVWVHEDDFPFQRLTCDLAVEPWLKASSQYLKAKWGLCAPQHAKMQIKGAFIDPWGNEVVPKGKIKRRFEIHDYGFS